jgi:Glycosyl hydrolases family 39
MFRSRASFSPMCLRSSALMLVLLLSVACSSSTQVSSPVSTPTPNTIPSLPGQESWKQGVSSFLFGTNDSQEWFSNNVETSPAIQQSLKDAHYTLMRTFFFDKSLADGHATTDAEIEQRLATIQKSGMVCLGVLHNIFDANFDKHVVMYAGSRCKIYEFGNESDYNGISIESYLKQWNEMIPLLRQVNPNAKFVGPVTYNDQGNHSFMRAFLEGVKASGILPDAISFHWYPCYQDSESACLGKAKSYSQVALRVRELVQSILGRDLPVGITEWNYDPGNPPPAYGDKPDFITKFSTDALQSMIQAGVTFACQFDAASYGGYGRLDMFNVETDQPKPQYYAIKALIQQYRPSSTQS